MPGFPLKKNNKKTNMVFKHFILPDVYIKQIRSVLEFGVPVWNSGHTKDEVDDIERVQKSYLQIVLGSKYDNYENALGLASIKSLQCRRYTLC